MKSHCLRAKRPIRPALISGFRSMKRLGVFILPPGWEASPSQGYPQNFAGVHLYTWVERDTVRVKCLAQEHNTMSPARPRTRTTRSGVERTNHEATATEPLGKYKRKRWQVHERKRANEKQHFVFSNKGALSLIHCNTHTQEFHRLRVSYP